MNVFPIIEVTNECKHNRERTELFSEILFLFKWKKSSDMKCFILSIIKVEF